MEVTFSVEQVTVFELVGMPPALTKCLGNLSLNAMQAMEFAFNRLWADNSFQSVFGRPEELS